jgi:hypothetical protein
VHTVEVALFRATSTGTANMEAGSALEEAADSPAAAIEPAGDAVETGSVPDDAADGLSASPAAALEPAGDAAYQAMLDYNGTGPFPLHHLHTWLNSSPWELSREDYGQKLNRLFRTDRGKKCVQARERSRRRRKHCVGVSRLVSGCASRRGIHIESA